MELANIILLICFGYTMFNLGQCYQIIKVIREYPRTDRA